MNTSKKMNELTHTETQPSHAPVKKAAWEFVALNENNHDNWLQGASFTAGEEHRLVTLIDASTMQNEAEWEPREITVEGNSTLTMLTIILGSADLNITARLIGEHASYIHHVLYLGDQKDRVNVSTFSKHAAQHTSAEMIVHGVATGQSIIDIKGNIFIEDGGQFTEAALEHEGLLMSRKARIHALPGFEIHTGDVKAMHSSAVHYIRPEQLFYLSTRGIQEQEGRRMIVDGFIEEMLLLCEDATIRKTLNAAVQKKMSTMQFAQ